MLKAVNRTNWLIVKLLVILRNKIYY